MNINIILNFINNRWNNIRLINDSLVEDPTNTYLISGSSDGYIRVWTKSTWALKNSFAAHANGVNSVSFLKISTSTYLLSGGGGTIKVKLIDSTLDNDVS